MCMRISILLLRSSGAIGASFISLKIDVFCILCISFSIASLYEITVSLKGCRYKFMYLLNIYSLWFFFQEVYLFCLEGVELLCSGFCLLAVLFNHVVCRFVVDDVKCFNVYLA